MDEKEIQQRIMVWCQQRPIKLAVLFGSMATGTTHPASDVDLAIWPVIEPDPATRRRWWSELQEALGAEVSLILVSADTDPVLGMEIGRHGRLLFALESETWLNERLNLWHAYNDSLPFRRAARQQLHDFASERPYAA